MFRTLMLAGFSLTFIATTASADTRPVPYYAFGQIRPNPNENAVSRQWMGETPAPHAQQAELYANEVDQIVRWGKVGRCVVGTDRDGSAAFAKTTYPSHAARAAANRLTPAFDACLAGTGVKARSNVALRQAAVIDALNTARAKP